MDKSTLQDSIQKMEAALTNDNIGESAKKGIEQSLEKAKGKLADLEKEENEKKEDEKQPPPEPITKPATNKKAAPKTPPKKDPLTKTEYYAQMDKLYPKLTLVQATEMKQKEYDALYAKLIKQAESLEVKNASDYADGYLYNHIPKGEKQKEEKKKKPVQDKSEVPKREGQKAEFSWRKAVPVEKLKPVVIDCQHYYIEVQKEMTVQLKGDGQASINVKATPGEYLIFDEGGYLVFVMNKASFQKKCVVEDGKKELITQKVNEGKPQGKKKESTKEVENPVQKAQEEKLPIPPKKKSNCSLKEAEDGRRLSKATKFFLDEAEAWNKSQNSRKITKIMRTKGETQDVIIEVADYKGFTTGLATLIGGKRKYFRLCIDSFNLTSADRPKNGTYTLIVSDRELRQVYTTKGNKQFGICLKTYRKLLKCSFEGSCTATDKEKWKTLYHQCGDLEQKLNKNPNVLHNFHIEVKKRRKPGERYSSAMSRVAQEIKSELTY